MRTLLMKKATGYLATASLVTSSFFVCVAQPVQAASATSVSMHVDGRKSADSPGLVRSTATKTETVTKDQQKHDKKTISRCWKRIITAIREVNHAHRNTQK
ncbi:hypothetical protein IC229_00335 [Spirosoma sp. BT702]|uniref:Uncharacterized protein n=1 Tax=Spirosoma profusum TaxID=2771354 RepID=A0A926XZB9_9BACT|nr:hypothetical protein [Spirosoma profusum]MBD2699065.1 hypothetical protein [Spirosoma profusum]